MHGQSDSDFQKSSEEFLAWFKVQEGAYFHPNLRIADLRNQDAGRGIGKRDMEEYGP